MNDKQVAIETIKNLPENSSMDQIAEELQIMAAIRKGKEDVAAAASNLILKWKSFLRNGFLSHK